MRSISGHSGHSDDTGTVGRQAQRPPLDETRRAPRTPGPQHDPRTHPASPRALRVRADRLLGRLRALRRGPVRGSRGDVDTIDAITEELQVLQAAFAAVASRGLPVDQRTELAGARRSITDALLLTLEMLQRLR